MTTHLAGTTSDALTNSPYLLAADMASFLKGEGGRFIINKEVLEHPDFKAWLANLQ